MSNRSFIKPLFLLLGVFAVCAEVVALPRDDVQKQAFRRENPCPSTGQKTGACPGYEVDHKKALMNRGADKPENMQWLSKEQHTEKTREDVSECKKSYLCKNKKMKKKLPWEEKKAKTQ